MVAGVEASRRKGASMEKVSIIGLDLAKNVFQAHGAAADGAVVFRRKLSRAQLLKFMAAQAPCVVAMEACASAHHWGRAIGDLGHEVRLIPPAYVKPFVKRQKNDMADAEAIAEAASRPTMRFVAVKSETQQAAAMAYRTRDLLVRQRTQTINALRGHLAEQGIVAPTGAAHVGRLAAIIDGEDGTMPAAVRDLARLLLDQIAGLTERIAGLDAELRKRGRYCAAADDDSGRGGCDCRRDHHICTANGDLLQGPGLCGLGWAHAATTFERRQGPTWPHLENGSARHSPPFDRRGCRRGAMGGTQRRSRGLLACQNVGPQAEDAGGGGTGQSHGAHGLGVAAQGRGLQESGVGGRLGRRRRVVAGCERERGNVRANGHETGPGVTG
jgi:hypothetical protein